MIKELGINFEPLEGVGFNNESHVGHFLNYLFRTDKPQKWTNDLTTNNIFMIKIKDKLNVINFPESLEERLKIKEKMHELILKTLESNPFESLKSDIIYMDIHDKDTKENYEHLLSLSQVKYVLSELIAVEKEDAGNLFFVAHLDQKESMYHLHTVYVEEG